MKGFLTRRPKKSKMMAVYFGYILGLIILSAAVFVLLYFKLSSFQKQRDEDKAKKEEQLEAAVEEKRTDPQKIAQKAFEDYADTMDAQWWADLWLKERPESPESPEALKAAFEKTLAAEPRSLYRDLSYTETQPVFKVKLGDKDAARISLKKEKGDGTYIADWSVSGTELLYKGSYDAEEYLPSGMRLLCNGKEVPAAEDTKTFFPYNGIKDLLEEPVQWHCYKAEGLMTEPELSYASDTEYLYSEEDGCYVCLANDLPADLKDQAEGFFRAYMQYTMSGGAGWKDYKKAKEEAEAEGREAPANPVMQRFNACCRYIPTDSVAYSMLYKAFDSTCYGLAYTDQDVGLMDTRGPLRWADNCVSIEFTYHAYATLNGQRKDYSGSDQLFRVFFVCRPNGWKIWAFSA